MQFIHLAMQQQLIPEHAAQEDEDIAAGLLLERGDLPGRVGDFDNPVAGDRGRWPDHAQRILAEMAGNKMFPAILVQSDPHRSPVRH